MDRRGWLDHRLRRCCLQYRLPDSIGPGCVVSAPVATDGLSMAAPVASDGPARRGWFDDPLQRCCLQVQLASTASERLLWRRAPGWSGSVIVGVLLAPSSLLPLGWELVDAALSRWTRLARGVCASTGCCISMVIG